MARQRWWFRPAAVGRCAAWLLAVALLGGCAVVPGRGAADGTAWVAAWGSAQLLPEQAAPGAAPPPAAWQLPLRDVTLRQVIRPTLDGAVLRVRVSNALGRTPLVLGGAGVALAVHGNAVVPVAAAMPGAPPATPPQAVPGTLRGLLFDRRPTLTLAPGAEAWSDPVTLAVQRHADLLVDLHVVQGGDPATAHPGSRIHAWARAGAQLGQAEWAGAVPRLGWWHLAALDVQAQAAPPVLVAVGDSITDGYGVQPGTYARWTDELSRRLAAAGRTAAVINTGIGGNRLLGEALGVRLTQRWSRDVLERSGVTHAVVMIGVNDLGGQHLAGRDTPAARQALLADMRSALATLAAQSRSRSVCTIASTVLPYGTSGYYKPGPENEADRQALNAWIRQSGVFDAVVDFDAVMRDPAEPGRLRRDLDIGDGLHPSMAGYRAMAEAFPVHLLDTRCAPPAATAMPATYTNPVLSGFAADPSVCRRGDDYYLATSSFEYWPAVPIHHSRDLVHWRLVGHAVNRESALSLAGRPSSKGIFAPTLRCDERGFYMVTTDIEGRGSFYVHAPDAKGPWSDPVFLNEPVFGMDPSLFFDDDGTVYYTRHGGGRNGGVYQARLDLQAGRLLEAPRLVWSGTGGIWPEGPHLYKRDGWYWLLISEGGTSYEHSLTMARSRSPWGPFEPHPDNPVLTHRGRPGEPLQALGHGDFVQTPQGDGWSVLLGIRAQQVGGQRHHHIGRETMLAPVRWRADGWPEVGTARGLPQPQPTAGLPAWAPWPAAPVRETFAPATPLPLHWARLRTSATGRWSLQDRPGWLRLLGDHTTLADVATPAFLGRRQQTLHQRIATELDFQPRAEGDIAGLALRQNEQHHLLLQVTGTTARRVECVARARGTARVVASAALPAGPVQLQVSATPGAYAMSWRASAAGASAAWQPLCELPTALLSTETAGGFTGVFAGPYASAGGSAPALADFAWFDFEATGP